MSGLIRKVDRKSRKPWIRQEMITKTAEQRKQINVNNEEGRERRRRLRNELKRATDKSRGGSIWRGYVTRSWNLKEQNF